jgi:acetolactate synthase-1/2/3 large subunit
VAVAAAMGPPGCVATLVLPADVSWSEVGSAGVGAGGPAAVPTPRRRSVVPGDTVEEVAKVLRGGESSALLLGGSSLRRRGLDAAARVAASAGAKLLAETFPARLERGAGIPGVERLGYLSEFVEAQLAGVRHLVLVDALAPVSFFAYPGKASYLVPEGCEVHTLAGPADDASLALEQLAEALGAPDAPVSAAAARPDAPTGPLTSESMAAAIAAWLPEGAVVADEANTSGLFAPGATAGCPPHDWLTLTGGAIGIGLPLATGAAVAVPDRPVLCLQADGSALYTMQALWTQAREGLDVTTVVMSNRSYAILNLELNRVGAGGGGPAAKRLLDLTEPDLDFVSLAQGLGVPASRATTADQLVAALGRARQEPGPALIEAVLPGWG